MILSWDGRFCFFFFGRRFGGLVGFYVFWDVTGVVVGVVGFGN